MGLAGAAVAHEDQILSALQVFPLGQAQDLGLVEGGHAGEVELVQGFKHREPGQPQPLLVGVFLPLLGLQLHQRQQEHLVGKVSLHGLPGHLLVMPAYGRQPQLFQVSFEEQALLHGPLLNHVPAGRSGPPGWATPATEHGARRTPAVR